MREIDEVSDFVVATIRSVLAADSWEDVVVASYKVALHDFLMKISPAWGRDVPTELIKVTCRNTIPWGKVIVMEVNEGIPFIILDEWDWIRGFGQVMIPVRGEICPKMNRIRIILFRVDSRHHTQELVAIGLSIISFAKFYIEYAIPYVGPQNPIKSLLPLNFGDGGGGFGSDSGFNLYEGDFIFGFFFYDLGLRFLGFRETQSPIFLQKCFLSSRHDFDKSFRTLTFPVKKSNKNSFF